MRRRRHNGLPSSQSDTWVVPSSVHPCVAGLGTCGIARRPEPGHTHPRAAVSGVMAAPLPAISEQSTGAQPPASWISNVPPETKRKTTNTGKSGYFHWSTPYWEEGWREGVLVVHHPYTAAAVSAGAAQFSIPYCDHHSWLTCLGPPPPFPPPFGPLSCRRYLCQCRVWDHCVGMAIYLPSITEALPSLCSGNRPTGNPRMLSARRG